MKLTNLQGKKKEKEEVLLPVSTVILTDTQTLSLNSMLEWVSLDTDSTVSVLTGFAGTGKTTLADMFIKECIKRYRHLNKKNICVSAPLHKAKKVITTKTGMKGKTIQSLLGLRPNTELKNFNINRPEFAQIADETIQEYKLIIVDECSQVNLSLDRLLRVRAKFWNVKILYIGDPYQLPPVGQIISTTFSKIKYKWELVEIVRQEKGNPLLELIGIIRNDIINGTNKSTTLLLKPKHDINKKGQGYIITNKKEVIEEVITELYRDSPEYSTDKDFIKFVTWSNVNVSVWNKYIRDIIFTNPTLIVNHDDLFMAYNSIISKKRNLLSLVNSEEYTIKTYANKVNKYGVKGYQVILNGVELNTTISVFIVAPSGYDIFVREHTRLLNRALHDRTPQNWKKYYEFKHENLITTDIIKNGKLLVKKDLDYGYASTVHKTQGSTYVNIVVNGKNINRCYTRLDRIRLWYVALSRASKVATIYV